MKISFSLDPVWYGIRVDETLTECNSPINHNKHNVDQILNPSGPSKFCFTGAGGTQRPRLLHVVWTLDSRNPHHCFPVDGWVVCWQGFANFPCWVRAKYIAPEIACSHATFSTSAAANLKRGDDHHRQNYRSYFLPLHHLLELLVDSFL
jgi:hypothetical protein